MAPTHGSSSEGSSGRTRKPAGETPPLPPSQAQEGRPWVWLVAPRRSGAAGQVVKPVDGSLNSAVSSPQSTTLCDPVAAWQAPRPLFLLPRLSASALWGARRSAV